MTASEAVWPRQSNRSTWQRAWHIEHPLDKSSLMLTIVSTRAAGGGTEMIDISTAGRDLQDEILKLIRMSQDTVVDALQSWTATVQSVTPSFPKLNLPYAD